MKERKRPGRKKRRKGLSKKESLYGILLAVVIVSILFTYFLLRSPSNQTNETFQFKAAIVDHLSLFEPNPTFNQTCTTILKTAGFTVDYYKGEEVTVEFYRNLPAHGYGIIILRVHSSAMALQEKEIVDFPVMIFTSEPYSKTKYVHEQLTDQLLIASLTIPEPPYYFAILPKFVTSSMKGKFQNTIIFMMGCDGLNNTKMAEAFVKKGAKAYISWNAGVLASHTDQATVHLLQHLITEKQTIKQAVTETMKEVGPDPVDESVLLFYPPEAENHAIPDTKSNLTTNVAEINQETIKLKEIVSFKTRNNSKN